MQLFKHNRAFYIPYIIWLAVGLAMLWHINKGDAVKLLNGSHTSTKDMLVYATNFMGNALFFILIGISLLFIETRKGLLALSGFLTSGLLAQALKHWVFYDSPRPVLFFGSTFPIHIPPGIHMYKMFSFPSGHTTSAFALFTTLALLYPKRWFQFLCVVLAIIAGLSRTYLGQHFLQDVVAGSVLGVVVSTANYYLFVKANWYNNKSWASLPLYKVIAKK